MYIIISIFAVYVFGIISYELNYFYYYCLLVFVILIYNSIKSKKFIYNFVLIVFILLSYINCYYNAKSVLVQYVNKDINMIVMIKNQNKIKSDSQYISFNGKVLSINGRDIEFKENTIIYFKKDEIVKPNSVFKIKGNVTDIGNNKNHLLFNYKNYLRAKKVYTVVFSENIIEVVKENVSLWNNIAYKFRLYAENVFYSNLNNRNAEIILSVILGDIDYLEEDFYDNIKVMGLAHIFAVSGTHIALLYCILLKLFQLVGFNRKSSWVITWLLIWFYGFLIGFPLSVLRALVMFTFLFGSEILYRKYNSLNSIALAALILTMYNPYWVFDAGFLLSFSAALSLIIFNKYILKKIKTDNIILKSIYLYLFLQICTLPVIVYFFNYLPVMGIVYNLLLLPIFSVILAYSFVLLVLYNMAYFILTIPFKLLDYILHCLSFIIDHTDKLYFNGIIIPSLSAYEVILYYIFIFFVIYLYCGYNKNISKYVLVTIICFYFITYIAVPLSDLNLYFNLIDVGQGMFSVISYRNYNFIVDCGSTSNKNLGEYTVVPYLTKKGIFNVDGVFISHWDEDHYSGLYDLLNSNIKVNRIFSGSNKDINTYINILSTDDNIRVDNMVELDVLWPDSDYITSNKNNVSLVILVKYKNISILFTGDIEEEAENLIYGNIGQSDILIIPHHCSKSSSTVNFVKAVNPTFALASYGKNNYGMPSEIVLKRYEDISCLVLSTFYNGEINYILKDDKIYYNTYIGTKSQNYYELYFIWFVPKIMFCSLLLIWYIIDYKKEEKYEL